MLISAVAVGDKVPLPAAQYLLRECCVDLYLSFCTLLQS